MLMTAQGFRVASLFFKTQRCQLLHLLSIVNIQHVHVLKWGKLFRKSYFLQWNKNNKHYQCFSQYYCPLGSLSITIVCSFINEWATCESISIYCHMPFFYILPLEMQILRGGCDPINRFNLATFLCLSQARFPMSHLVVFFLFGV